MGDTRLIAGNLYTRAALPYAHDIRVHELGHGHTEATVSPRYAWHEADVPDQVITDALMAQSHVWENGGWVPAKAAPESELLDRLAMNKERASRRAKTKVRRLCKHKGLSVMLTLTYRELMTDRARMARDFDVFMKRLRRAVPGVEYVCVFELQKRGAWHAHIAVPRILSHYLRGGMLVRSYDLLRSMWRGVVGADNGNVDVSRNKRVARSSARLATYISKYISKTFSDAALGGRDSYSASGKALPGAVVVRVPSVVLGTAIAALMDLIGVECDRAKHFHQALLDGGGYFLCLSPADRGPA